MAEGYTVAEAAELLGIPQRRVLQLIERGVLHGGLDERRRWRVHLVAPTGEVASGHGAADAGPADGERVAGPNGDRGGHGASGEHAVSDESRGYFRELLAELRHLQERYGQALLALGEARGESAALRERLGHLESHREVRLGPPEVATPTRAAERPFEASTTTSAPPDPADGVMAATASADEASEVPADQLDEPSIDRVVELPQPEPAPRAGRFGSTSVSEAMARAKDPAVFELPGAREAAVALAALQQTPRPPAAPTPATPEPRSAVAAPEPVPPVARPKQRPPVARAEPVPPVARPEPATPIARAEPSRTPPPPAPRRDAIEIHDHADLRSAVGLRRAAGPEVSRSASLRELDRPLDRLRRWLAG